MRKIHKLLSLGVLAGVLSVPSAFALSYSAFSDGVVAPAGVTFTGYTGAVVTDLGIKKSADGYFNLGVKGGYSGNEIDVGQSLKIAFDAPLRVTSLTIGLLFDGPEYYDYHETAVAQIWGTLSQYRLAATGATSATWSGSGSVSNVAPAVSGKGAVWTILNPFGDLAISGFVLFPEVPSDAPRGRTKVDFGLNAFTAEALTRVPDAASSIALLGVGLFGLALWSKRRASV